MPTRRGTRSNGSSKCWLWPAWVFRLSVCVVKLRPQLRLSYSFSAFPMADVDLSAFFVHLQTCRCPRSKGGRRNHHTSYGAKRYRDYLVQIGVCQCGASPSKIADPALVVGFGQWLQKHRGAARSTIRQYSRGANDLITALGNDPTRWDAKSVRAYFFGTRHSVWCWDG